jgi:hypothetical protein
MAVFVCVVDESYDQDNFFYGGFAAPITDWEGCFATAWNERVLNGPPRIPYLHMREILNPDWQKEYGLTEKDAHHRLDEAANVICSMGSLIPVIVYADKKQYDSTLGKVEFQPGGRSKHRFKPDYMSFIYVSAKQLEKIREWYPDVERVDFRPDQNGHVTKILGEFRDEFVETLRTRGDDQVAALIGHLKEVGKDCVAAQAADMLVWHARRAKRGTPGDRDVKMRLRYWHMIEGGKGTSEARFGHRGELDLAFMESLAKTLAEIEARNLP